MSSSHIPALEFLGGAVIRILAAYLVGELPQYEPLVTR